MGGEAPGGEIGLGRTGLEWIHAPNPFMIEQMVHITESELARDVHAVLAKVQEGFEVVIEQDHRPIAVIKPPAPVGRMISEVLADLKERGSTAVMDDDFARDIEDGIEAQRQPCAARVAPG